MFNRARLATIEALCQSANSIVVNHIPEVGEFGCLLCVPNAFIRELRAVKVDVAIPKSRKRWKSYPARVKADGRMCGAQITAAASSEAWTFAIWHIQLKNLLVIFDEKNYVGFVFDR